MGYRGLTDAEMKRAIAEQEALDRQEKKLRDNEQQALAAKIAMAIVDQIVHEIIRPGPKPEERECYVMAEELRAITPRLETLTRRILDVASDENATR